MTSDRPPATTASARPVPEPDDESQEFYAGARRHELMLMRCRACRAWRLPSRPRCPDCWSTDTEWARASGRGTLYSFGIMHQKFPGFEDDAPYNYAVVELEEGPRIVSNIVGVAAADLRCDMPLQAVFDDVAPDTTLVRFTKAG
ncbi:MAG TPA: Zn-ribbon domain-containing OB-fold protein [Dehalococcoidia bacterium]|nr:Zn-ribbon domain-containing OB-fold protein [Dehalococcoidia bacterium]